MIIILTLLIGGIIGMVLVPVILTFIVITVMWICLIPFVIWYSYDSKIELEVFYYNELDVMREALKDYGEQASVDFKNASATDFKYNQYQKRINEMIIDLKDKINWYNRTLIFKTNYKKNPFFSWYIILPDEDLEALDY